LEGLPFTTKITMSIEACLDILNPILTEERKMRFEEILEQRTKYITMVLEDVYQSRNTSAVMRSADGFGIQDIHMIETYNRWAKNLSVSKGSSSWLTVHRYLDAENPHEECLSTLRSSGYRIVATSPQEGGYTPDTLPLDKPIAIIMGTEFTGVSDKLLSQVDDYVAIPMSGFAESFNVSVASAILMNRLTERVKSSGDWVGLTEDEKQYLRLQWAYRTVRDSGAILKRYGLELPIEA
jgi:tRNA (guanosine-2'-O-)-methyltransferase